MEQQVYDFHYLMLKEEDFNILVRISIISVYFFLPDIITLNQLTKILDVDLNYFSEYLQSRDETVHKIGGNATTEADQIIQGKFYGSSLSESDFSGADLVGSTFTGNDMRKANFDGANLTDYILSVIDISESSFNDTILVRGTNPGKVQ